MRSTYETSVKVLEKCFRVDARYFLSGGFWLTLGQGITILFGIITTALFAQFLDANDYGVYKYLIGIAALLSTFSLTGIGQSILQTSAKKYYGFYRQTLHSNFIYSLPITVVSLATSGYYYINGNMTLSIGCLLISILQPLINRVRFIQPFLKGSGRFRESTTLYTIQTIFVTAVSLGTLYFTQNILWLFTAYLSTQLILNFVAHIYFLPPNTDVPADVTSLYLKYAKNTSFRNLVAGIANRADTVIVFTQLGAVELALYSIATIIPEQIKGSFKNLASLLFPKYAQHSDVKQIKKSVPKRSLQLLVLLTAITVAYIFTAPFIYELLFPKYPSAVLYSQIAALSFPMFILFIPYSILKSQLEETKLYKITLYTSVFQLAVLGSLVFHFGLMGAIVAKLIHRASLLVITYWFLYKSK